MSFFYNFPAFHVSIFAVSINKSRSLKKEKEMKNLVVFFEIPAVNFGRAIDFYEELLNCKMEIMECETEKMAFFPSEDGVAPGAISYASDFKPSKDGVLVSLGVENMEKALAQVEKNGGRVLRDKTKIEAESRGYFALFMDSEGNQLGLYSDK